MGRGDAEKLDCFMIDRIRNEKDPLNLASAVIYCEDSFLEKISVLDIGAIIEKLSKAHGNMEEGNNKEFLRIAIERLTDRKPN